MKKRKKNLEYSFGPLVLYLDDLETIEQHLKEPGWKVEIETENYVFETVKELKKQLVEKEQKSYLTELCFDITDNKEEDFFTNPIGQLRFSPTLHSHLNFEKDNTESSGILFKIQTLLEKKKRKFVLNYKYTPVFMFLGFVFSGVLIPLFLDKDFVQQLPAVVIVIYLVFMAFFWFWFIWSMRINEKESALIILKRKEQSSFWQRNKEKIFWRIIVPVIAACLGGTLVAFFTHLLNK